MAHHAGLMLRVPGRGGGAGRRRGWRLRRRSDARARGLGRSQRRPVVAIDPSPQDQLVTLADRARPAGAHPRGEPRCPAGDFDCPMWRDRRRSQLLHGPARAPPDSRSCSGRRAAATDVSRRMLAARSSRRLLRPAQIPAGYRQPIVGDGAGIAPGDPGVRPDGLPYPRSAAREGGERNGVLTAVEDFVASDDALRLVVVPAFFGFGVVWHGDAPWADRVSRLLDPYAANPLLARLESNRVLHIAREHALRVELWRERESRARQERVLRRILESSAFGVAERLSRLRVRTASRPTSQWSHATRCDARSRSCPGDRGSPARASSAARRARASGAPGLAQAAGGASPQRRGGSPRESFCVASLEPRSSSSTRASSPSLRE